MGGDYYDREMNDNPEEIIQRNEQIENENRNKVFGGIGTTISNSNVNYNSKQFKIGIQNGLHPSLDPRNYKDKNLKSFSKHPIVFALDVTGSMCDWPQVIYDKMPMFFGQIMMQKYLTDVSISFCAVSDYGDEITLQVTEFSKAHQIDERISLLHLGGGMGPLVRHEAYEASAFFYSYMVDLEKCELPFYFLTCDEDFYPEVAQYKIKKKLGRDIPYENIKAKKIFGDLLKNYNVFIIKKPYNTNIEPNELDQWISVVGKERILVINNPKAGIDLILGAIAITNGLSLEKYLNDMNKRGQTEDRINLVKESLNLYYESITNGKIKIIKRNVEGEEIKMVEELSEKEKRISNFLKKFNGVNYENDKFLNLMKENFDKVELEFSGKIPSELLCPLTKRLFIEPVKMSDGSTFERQAMEKWLELYDVHPTTEEIFSNKNYLMDNKMLSEVNEYYETVKNLI